MEVFVASCRDYTAARKRCVATLAAIRSMVDHRQSLTEGMRQITLGGVTQTTLAPRPNTSSRDDTEEEEEEEDGQKGGSGSGLVPAAVAGDTSTTSSVVPSVVPSAITTPLGVLNFFQPSEITPTTAQSTSSTTVAELPSALVGQLNDDLNALLGDLSSAVHDLEAARNKASDKGVAPIYQAMLENQEVSQEEEHDVEEELSSARSTRRQRGTPAVEEVLSIGGRPVPFDPPLVLGALEGAAHRMAGHAAYLAQMLSPLRVLVFGDFSDVSGIFLDPSLSSMAGAAEEDVAAAIDVYVNLASFNPIHLPSKGTAARHGRHHHGGGGGNTNVDPMEHAAVILAMYCSS